MATNKIVNQSILSPTAKNVGIATTIEFLYCLSVRDIVKTAVSGCPFCDPRWRTKQFSVQMETLVLVSERSELSKNVYIKICNSPKNSNENTQLTISEKFSTYEEFVDKLTNYENTTFVKFWKRDIRKIATQQKRSKKVLSLALRY